MRTCTYLDHQQAERCTECGAHISMCVCENVDEDAHERLYSTLGHILNLTRESFEQELKKYPNPACLFLDLIVELGELSKILIENEEKNDTLRPEVFRKAISIAATILRIAEESHNLSREY